MLQFNALSFPLLLSVFGVAAVVVLVCGVKLTRQADDFAKITGLGGAITGAVLLGLITSLSGSITSVTAALQGHAELAISNAIGGIAAQTVFLVLADLTYRKANLEHSAASVPNMIAGTVLIALLAIILMAAALPDSAVFHIHPVTVLLFVIYLLGVRFSHQAQQNPSWRPSGGDEEAAKEEGADTVSENTSLGRLISSIAALGLVCGLAGLVIAEAGVEIAERTGIRQGVVGFLLTAVITSLPELVTTLTAIRRGALTLAVGGILGGNTFDVLFIAFADISYLDGSIYHAAAADQLFMVHVSILMTTILLLGLLRRERYGPANIGFESIALIIVYISAILVVVTQF